MPISNSGEVPIVFHRPVMASLITERCKSPQVLLVQVRVKRPDHQIGSQEQCYI